MANYYEWSIADVTDPDKVATAHGDAPDGTPRICISLEGEPIHPHIASEWHGDGGVNWRALTPRCARTLYRLLGMAKHQFLEALDLPNSNAQSSYVHCALCLAELKDPDRDIIQGEEQETPASYARLSVAWTKQGLQIWCVRHDCNVMHIHFEGETHPANMTRALTPAEVAEVSARMTAAELAAAGEEGEPVCRVTGEGLCPELVLVATGGWTVVSPQGHYPAPRLIKNRSTKKTLWVRSTEMSGKHPYTAAIVLAPGAEWTAHQGLGAVLATVATEAGNWPPCPA